MVKIVLESREAFQDIEERLNNAVQDFVDVSCHCRFPSWSAGIM